MGAIRSTSVMVGGAALLLALVVVVAILDEPNATYETLSTVPAKLIQIFILLTFIFGLAINIYWLFNDPTPARLMLGISRACTAAIFTTAIAAPSIWAVKAVSIHSPHWSFSLSWGDPVWASFFTFTVAIIGAVWTGREYARYSRPVRRR